jgi:hypothetical protein
MDHQARDPQARDHQAPDHQLMSAHPRVVIKLLLVSNMVPRQRVAVAQTPNANGQSRCPAMQAQPVPAMS